MLLLALPFVFWAISRYGSTKGSLIAILGGMMFLPEQAHLKLPLLPEFTKHRIIFVGLLLAWAFGKLKLRGRSEWWCWPLLILAFASGLLAWRTNMEPLYYGPTHIPALNFKDGMYVSLAEIMGPVGAAYLGSRLFRDERDLNTLIRVLAGSGVIYSAFCAVELVMSPQIHRWVYGYHAHEMFSQTYRFGGWRPQVFMAHGLAASLYMLGTAMAAMALARHGQKVWDWSGSRVAWGLTAMVVLCKSTGVWLYSVVGIPLSRWLSAKVMVRLAVVIALLVCAYPYLRITDQFPTQMILDFAASIEQDRMYSLKFRFDNEAVLLEHALKKPWFGWSYSYGRNRLYDDYGGEITVTDGGWIIAFGASGVLGLIMSLGGPVFAILTIWRRLGRIKDVKARTNLAIMTLYLAFMLLDVIPNAAFNWLQFYMAGALCSISQGLVLAKAKKAPQKTAAEPAPRRDEGEPEAQVPAPITV